VIKAAGTFEKAGRIDEVRKAAGVDVDLDARIFADEGAGGAGVIKMNVSEEDGVHVREI